MRMQPWLIDLHHVAGLEPAVVGELLGAAAVEVGGRDPRSANLELAHRLVVPRDQLAVVAARADLDERRREALASAVVVLLIVGRIVEVGGAGRAARERRGLGHAPALEDRRGRARRNPRSCSWAPPSRRPGVGAARSGPTAPGSASIALSIAIQTVGTPAVSVTRSSASRSSTLSASSFGPGSTSDGADQRRGVRDTPRVGVEHRHDRQHRVARGDVHRVRQRRGHRVQDERAVRVEDALGPAGGARRVTHRGGPALVRARPARPARLRSSSSDS